MTTRSDTRKQLSTFEILWNWLFRLVVGFSALALGLGLLLVFSMNRPLVRQSDGYVARSAANGLVTLTGAFPDSAIDIRYCSSSVGLGGRLRAYRFSGPVDVLHKHAAHEFESHWDKVEFQTTSAAESPITADDIRHLQSAYGVDVPWMLPPTGAIGTVYAPADGCSSHQPLIFVDEGNETLYFVMTD